MRPKSVDCGRVAQVTKDLIPVEPVAPVRDQQDPIMTLLQQVLQQTDQQEARIAVMQVGPRTLSPLAEPRDPKWTGQGPSQSDPKDRGPVVCHRCKKEGHLARGCVAPRTQPGYTTHLGKWEALGVTGQTSEGSSKAKPQESPALSVPG